MPLEKYSYAGKRFFLTNIINNSINGIFYSQVSHELVIIKEHSQSSDQRTLLLAPPEVFGSRSNRTLSLIAATPAAIERENDFFDRA